MGGRHLTLFGLVHTAARAITAAEKAEIVNKHNELRRGVRPPASDMLEMVSKKRRRLP